MMQMSDILSSKNITDTFEYRKPFIDPLVMDKTSNIINELFKTLAGIFPAFKQAWPSEHELKNAKKEWIKGFIQAGLCDMSVILHGVEKLRQKNSPFIPSIGEFIEICKLNNKELGLPDVEEAFKIAVYNAKGYNAIKRSWIHNAVRYASQLTSGNVLNTKPEKECFAIFKKHYENIIDDLLIAKKEGRKESEVLPDFSMRDNSRHEQIAREKKEIEARDFLKNKEHEERNQKLKYELGGYENWTAQQLSNSITDKQKKNWKPSEVFQQYVHLTSSEKCLSVVYEKLKVWEQKQKEIMGKIRCK